ncbi:OsmC family protein [uncultured Thiothrix sp.]|uniref:OsmC family protein n=1 Tax=uncultured Thiothrix sp. TaxID=223185 RepID=UPI00261F602D|nr:OsmC family protein [uncultured Thiothrix sp.]
MAHQYTAEVIWERGQQAFLDNRYSRQYLMKFDGGIEVIGSSSPWVVPLPLSAPQAVDPEESFVSAISSCHMLWFLSIAAKRGFVVDFYHDQAVGVMTANAHKKYWVSEVVLQPKILFSGVKLPSLAAIQQMHDEAHEECFIANSVKTQITISAQ